MNCHHPIVAIDYFHQHALVTREVATLLIEKVLENQCNYIEIDFSGISFISRSFADQFHKEKMKLWEQRKKEIHIVNAHPDVLEMLRAVSKTQNLDNRRYESYPHLEFESRRFMKQYFSGI